MLSKGFKTQAQGEEERPVKKTVPHSDTASKPPRHTIYKSEHKQTA
jgi:hypothetical protein